MTIAGGSPYSISKPTGRCAESGAPIAIGERFVAALVELPGQDALERRDFALAAWQAGARPRGPERLFASWSAVMPDPQHKTNPLLSDAELLDLFEQIGPEVQGKRAAFRYLLALVLVRKRLLKYEGVRAGRMLLRPRGLPAESPPIEVLDPQMDEAAIGEAMEELGQIMNMSDAGAGGPGAATDGGAR